jgi:hypothetical protein
MVKPTLSGFTPISDLLIQEYERYLPTAFDNSLSLLEKVNMAIQKLAEIGKITNDLVTQWNGVMEWIINEGLEDTVNAKIQQMYDDGILDDLIDNLIRSLFTKEFTITSLKHNAYLGAMLDIPDIMQGVKYDKANKCLYVAYEDQHNRFASPTLILAKLDLTGKMIGEMFFTGFAHGDGFSIDVNTIQNIVLNLEKGGIYNTVRLTFAAGTTITDFSQLNVLPAFNGRDWKLSFNEERNVFVLVDGQAGDKIYVYKQNLFNFTILPNPDLTIVLDPSARPYQGVAVGKESIYYSSGVDSNAPTIGTYPQTLWEYKIEDGSFVQKKLFSEFASSDSANGYSEPEGIQVVVDDFGAETLLVGYVHGEFRQRMNDIYEFSSKGVSPITRRIVRGFYKENGVVKKLINDVAKNLSDIFESGSYYVQNAADLPVSRAGFLSVNVSYDGTNILQEFTSSANVTYKRWIFWTNSTKTVSDWLEDKTVNNFSRGSYVDATLVNGVTKGGALPQLRSYVEASPIGHRAYVEGACLIDSATLPITSGFTKIATLAHKPFTTIPINCSTIAASTQNVVGYINNLGEIFVQGSAATGSYYSFGTISFATAD